MDILQLIADLCFWPMDPVNFTEDNPLLMVMVVSIVGATIFSLTWRFFYALSHIR